MNSPSIQTGEKLRQSSKTVLTIPRMTPRAVSLLLLSVRKMRLFPGLHRSLSGLKTDLGMLSVTERLIHRRAAAAQSDGLLAADVVLIAIGVLELELA